MKTTEVGKELVEFEILYSSLVKPQKSIHDMIKMGRQKAWKESLQRAKGNEEKAAEIFDELYP